MTLSAGTREKWIPVLAAVGAACLAMVASGAPIAAQGSLGTPAAAPHQPPVAAAAARARSLAQAAVEDQRLPGLSIAVGAGGSVVWAEGFGWRDVSTRTPVTSETRFHIGSAASAVIDNAGPLRLTRTGIDAAAIWSPEHIGEPEEDFPLFTLLRHVLWQPLGLMASEYPLPGDRATFYVPRDHDDPRTGQRLMAMRDLACCANGMAFASTPSDVARLALATHPADFDGRLAGGLVMSLRTARSTGVVVAVSSNIAHAKTDAVAERVAAAFAAEGR